MPEVADLIEAYGSVPAASPAPGVRLRPTFQLNYGIIPP